MKLLNSLIISVRIANDHHYIIKVAPQCDFCRDLFDFRSQFVCEVTVYRCILPIFQMFLAGNVLSPYTEFFLDGSKDEGQEYVLLADLAVPGYRIFQRSQPIGFKICHKIMRIFAHLHARSFALERMYPRVMATM